MEGKCQIIRVQRWKRTSDLIHEGYVYEVPAGRHGLLAGDKFLCSLRSFKIKIIKQKRFFLKQKDQICRNLTLATSFRETLSMFLEISSVDWCDPLAKAWAPTASSKPSDVSRDIMKWAFSWALTGGKNKTKKETLFEPKDLQWKTDFFFPLVTSYLARVRSAAVTPPSATAFTWATAALITLRDETWELLPWKWV